MLGTKGCFFIELKRILHNVELFPSLTLSHAEYSSFDPIPQPLKIINSAHGNSLTN